MNEAAKDRTGRLIVFEGIDGAGKTTQVRRAARALREKGLEVVKLVEPSGGPYGRKIREMARGSVRRLSPEEELELFILDRRDDVERNILPALRRGDIVLLDRYYYSTMAYQGALGLDPETILEKNSFAPRPDLVLYLAIDVDEALRRIERSRKGNTDLFERREYLERVKAIFDDLARRFENFRTIEGTADEETVARRVLEAIETYLFGPRNRC